MTTIPPGKPAFSLSKPLAGRFAGHGLKDAKSVWPLFSLAALSGLNLLDYLDRQILAAVLTPVKDELHLSDEQLGTIATAFMLGYFLTAPIFGHLGDRLPRKWLIAAGVFVWSLGTVLSGHATTFASLIWFRALVGFGEASFGTISPGWIADLFPAQRRNNALSIFYLAIPVGSALGYIVGAVLAAHYGWRAAFLWAGAPGLLLALGLFVLREPVRGASDPAMGAAQPTPGGVMAFRQLLKLPDYLLVVAGYIAQTFAMGGFAFWAPTFLHRVHGMNLQSAGTFFGGALVLTGLTATLLGGLAATDWQRRTGTGYAWVLALSALGAAPAAFAAFMLSNLAAAKVALVLSMFLLFLTTGPVNTLILESVPVMMRATAMAGSIFAIHLFGDLWSAKLVGLLSDRFGDLQRAVLWVLPSALIVSAFFWVCLVVHTRRLRQATG
ncbi:MAG: MFS transporter [Opitutaceae bacterium]|nr:MFS transporter [Opitutaceae bacterium]